MRNNIFFLMIIFFIVLSCNNKKEAPLIEEFQNIKNINTDVLEYSENIDNIITQEVVDKIDNEFQQPSGNNAACLFIRELYSRFWELDREDELKWKTIPELKAALLSFFNSEESLSVDIDAELPFLSTAISNDGFIRIYNWKWYFGGRYDPFDTIIQYILPSGKFYTQDFLGPESVEFHNIYLLKENIYLLYGTTWSMVR